MSQPPRRSRGRVVPPPRPALPVESEDDPFDRFSTITLHFNPALTLAEFNRFAAAHELDSADYEDEPHVYCTPDGVDVAYGEMGVLPLPSQVAELLICGTDGPNAPAVLALSEAMLAAWPRARWEASEGFTSFLSRRAPDRRMRQERRRR